ncbi:MAG: phosphoribosyltransferase family protein [Flavobacteriales bacterium]|jgi:pyrimidine operon attenuation protein/uracil phosphoribosyltransferase|nr:MAG: phosphoribosyltransferase family protein [Flavobacteriales bacterium]
MSERTVILEHEQVQRKLRRIAHQLHEEHHEAGALVLVGIAPRGAILAKRLARLLEEVSDLRIDLVELKLDKDLPLERPVQLSIDPMSLRDRLVVLVDDVLMSGRTLMHAASYLVQAPLKRLTTVVLVDRRHRAYPIRADIVGLTLSTTLQEHISVELGRKDAVYLS